MQFKSYEIPAKIHLEPTPFGDDKLTPSMKIKRRELRNFYSDVIEDLYKQFERDEAEAIAKVMALLKDEWKNFKGWLIYCCNYIY